MLVKPGEGQKSAKSLLTNGVLCGMLGITGWLRKGLSLALKSELAPSLEGADSCGKHVSRAAAARQRTEKSRLTTFLERTRLLKRHLFRIMELANNSGSIS